MALLFPSQVTVTRTPTSKLIRYSTTLLFFFFCSCCLFSAHDSCQESCRGALQEASENRFENVPERLQFLEMVTNPPLIFLIFPFLSSDLSSNFSYLFINSKTVARLATSRIKLLRNKREAQIKQMRRDVALLLQSGQDDTARIRVWNPFPPFCVQHYPLNVFVQFACFIGSSVLFFFWVSISVRFLLPQGKRKKCIIDIIRWGLI